MTSWISLDDRMKHGLKILDQLENSKLRLLVNRICQSLQYGISRNIFSEEEEEKLLDSLNVEKNDLSSLLQTVTSIYTQAAFHLIKPNTIEASMKENFSIGNDKSAILAHAWITHNEVIISALKRQSIFPTKIKDISWSVDVRAGSNAIAREAKPLAKLQLDVGDDEPRITVEMNKKDLWELHHKLDDIQSQLDALKKEK